MRQSGIARVGEVRRDLTKLDDSPADTFIDL